MTDALAVTADGAVFRGRSVGADGVTVGEAVFNTAMAGYQEIFTDPSYAGQVVVMTSSHIGNYGVSSEDNQAAEPWAKGVIVRALSRKDSNWRSEGTLASFLRQRGLVALSDVDTRRLTRHIRDKGAQPIAMGTDVDESELTELAVSAPRMDGQDLALTVTTDTPFEIAAEGTSNGTVVAFDFGLKRDIGSQLAARGYDVVVVPATTTPEDVMAHQPVGVFLSNGPGDPEPLTGPIETIQALLGQVPVFGICLGHQLLGLALGATTFKLPFGHHGGNHPVQNLEDGTVAITSQNHGFSVDPWSLTDQESPAQTGLADRSMLPDELTTSHGRAVPTHQNLNDGTLEGLRCLDIPAFGVQYHPEAAPGPRDAVGLFDDFVALMGAGE